MLSTKKFLLCCSTGSGGELAQELTQAGAEVVVFAPLRIHLLPENEAIRETLARLEQFSWLIFGSPHGVYALDHFLRLYALHPQNADRLRIGIVGQKAAAALAERFPSWPTPLSAPRLQALLQAIAQQSPAGVVEILNPTSQQSLEKIELEPTGNLQLTRLPLYQTVAEVDPSPVHVIGQEHYDALIFTSPSAFDAFLAKVGNEVLANHGVLVTLGETTRKYIEKKGFSVSIVPRQPTAFSLVDALTTYWAGEH